MEGCGLGDRIQSSREALSDCPDFTEFLPLRFSVCLFCGPQGQRWLGVWGARRVLGQRGSGKAGAGDRIGRACHLCLLSASPSEYNDHHLLPLSSHLLPNCHLYIKI